MGVVVLDGQPVIGRRKGQPRLAHVWHKVHVEADHPGQSAVRGVREWDYRRTTVVLQRLGEGNRVRLVIIPDGVAAGSIKMARFSKGNSWLRRMGWSASWR